MTALPPLETRNVIGSSTSIYEANKICAHPNCAEDVPDRGHHIFFRFADRKRQVFRVQAYASDGAGQCSIILFRTLLVCVERTTTMPNCITPGSNMRTESSSGTTDRILNATGHAIVSAPMRVVAIASPRRGMGARRCA